MATFQFYLQSGKQRKLEWVGEDSQVVIGQTFRGEDTKCRDATASSFVANFWAKS
jgi:hypothetical protein